MSLTKLVVNCENGTQEYIPLTASEIAEAEDRAAEAITQEAAENSARAAAEAARESARAKLAALGLTEAEVAALVK